MQTTPADDVYFDHKRILGTSSKNGIMKSVFLSDDRVLYTHVVTLTWERLKLHDQLAQQCKKCWDLGIQSGNDPSQGASVLLDCHYNLAGAYGTGVRRLPAIEQEIFRQKMEVKIVGRKEIAAERERQEALEAEI